jgi:hypothetical protein
MASNNLIISLKEYITHNNNDINNYRMLTKSNMLSSNSVMEVILTNEYPINYNDEIVMNKLTCPAESNENGVNYTVSCPSLELLNNRYNTKGYIEYIITCPKSIHGGEYHYICPYQYSYPVCNEWNEELNEYITSDKCFVSSYNVSSTTCTCSLDALSPVTTNSARDKIVEYKVELSSYLIYNNTIKPFEAIWDRANPPQVIEILSFFTDYVLFYTILTGVIVTILYLLFNNYKKEIYSYLYYGNNNYDTIAIQNIDNDISTNVNNDISTINNVSGSDDCNSTISTNSNDYNSVVEELESQLEEENHVARRLSDEIESNYPEYTTTTTTTTTRLSWRSVNLHISPILSPSDTASNNDDDVSDFKQNKSLNRFSFSNKDLNNIIKNKEFELFSLNQPEVKSISIDPTSDVSYSPVDYNNEKRFKFPNSPSIYITVFPSPPTNISINIGNNNSSNGRSDGNNLSIYSPTSEGSHGEESYLANF